MKTLILIVYLTAAHGADAITMKYFGATLVEHHMEAAIIEGDIEQCRQGYAKVRSYIANLDGGELDLIFCAEVTEEEAIDPNDIIDKYIIEKK